jgi:peptidoglycan/LPS O-acetylase OafA/YrhL
VTESALKPRVPVPTIVEPFRAPGKAISRNWWWPESGALSPLPALDGLRGLAVVLVLIFHAWYKAPAIVSVNQNELERFALWQAHTGVHLFFVLSGFLLFLPYARWAIGAQTGRPNTSDFYRRRILRVGPAFWFSLAVLLAAAPLSATRIFEALLHAVYLFNFFPGIGYHFNDVYWTMAVEVQFYAVLPLIGLALHAATKRFGLGPATILLILGCVGVSGASIWLGSRYQPLGIGWAGLVGRYSLSFFMVVFGVGIGCSMAYTYFLNASRLAEARRHQAEIAGTALLLGGVVLILALVFVHTAAGTPLGSKFYGLGFAPAYGALLLATLIGTRPLTWFFEHPVMRFLGFISYSLYLWHTIALRIVAGPLSALPHPWEQFVAGIGVEIFLAVPIAYFSYQLIERPFLKRATPRRTAPASSIATLRP